MTSPVPVSDALQQLLGHEAWAVVRRGVEPTCSLVGGSLRSVEKLDDIPLEQGSPEPGRLFDRLVAVPFRQIAERGFEVHDDGTPLAVVDIETELHFPIAEVIGALPDVPVEFADEGGFESTDAEYAEMVRHIIDAEIGQGEGANLVIGRHYRAQLKDWGPQQALTVLRRLLEREQGAYWAYCFWTGDRFLVGASPERHVSVHGGDVRMNPISGTFRLGGLAPEEQKPELLKFLADEKEIYELFMVVDEELKMMCDICNEGGQVLGPFLKPMSQLVHTEYLLAGRTTRDVRRVLRDTMFAATVTGSPVENAVRLIKQYEPEGRGYYAGALALIGRDAEGRPTADSPIIIRTADVSPEGALKVTAGATLVRDSDPDSEVAETRAKASGVLNAFGLVSAPPSRAAAVADLARDEDVLIALGTRNQRLSKFWLTDQAGKSPDPRLKGKSAVILDGEDDFVNMLRHVLSVLGLTSSVVKHPDFSPGALDGHDLVIVGPGPGDPRDGEHPKIAIFREAVEGLLEREQPFLAVCLGHQVTCDRLGIPLAFKDIVFQGTQSPIQVPDASGDIREERVGFYNTFVGRPSRTAGGGGELPGGVRVVADQESGDIHMLIGPHFRGVQFHPESILTEHGYDLLHDLLLELLGG